MRVLLRTVATALGVGAVAFGAVGGTAGPAGADCVEFYVGLTWSNGHETRVTPWAEGTCLVPTPFPTVSQPSGGGDDNNLPPNPPHPDGYRWSANIVMA